MSREMKDSGIAWIGEIPKGWEVKKGKFMFKVLSGAPFASELFTNDSNYMPLIRIRDIMQEHTETYYMGSYTQEYVITKGDILIGMDGDFNVSIWKGCNALLNQRVCKLYQFKNDIFSKFIYYALPLFLKRKNDLTYATTVKHLSTFDLLAFSFILPPLPEQQKIAEFLDRKCGEIDELVALQEKMIEELKAYKQSVITEAVTKGLNPNTPMKDSGIEWIGEIPEHWKVKLLSTLFNEHKQKNVGLKETNLLSLSYGKIIKKDINTKEGLLPESFDGYNIISKGDIVFRLTDLQNDKKSLRTGLCLETGIITSAYVTIRARIQLDSTYYYYLVHTYDICKVFYGMGDGVRQGMNYSDLRKILLIFPSFNEQQQIADYLDRKCAEIDELVAVKQQKIETLKEYKKSLIYEYVTGKKEVI